MLYFPAASILIELWFSLAGYKPGSYGIILLSPQLPMRLLLPGFVSSGITTISAGALFHAFFRELPVTHSFFSFTRAAVLLYFYVYNRPLALALDSIFWSLFNSDHFSHIIGLCNNTIATRQSALLKHALQIVTFDLISFFNTLKHCYLFLTPALVPL